MSTREEARRLVENIGRDHGHIPQEILDRIPLADRDVIMQAMQSKDRLIASSVMTLARNLYTSNARFVFELLQNCDDNHYDSARRRGERPYVEFSVYSDRIVMECNEDGFSPANLTAICNVGKSSKQGNQGYIGEKGIGFKSVFMAAYRVRIQSGHFSFHFTHRNGDSGMGMITPVWQDHEDNLDSHITRITLFLHDDGNPQVLDKQRQTIRQQFREIHETILLFMKTMQRIRVIFYDRNDNAEYSTTYSIDRLSDTRVVVTKSVRRNGDEQRDVRCYHTTKHVASNLARSENRTYSDDERRTKAYSRSEVVLAFPLDEDSSPVIENQWVFAFLPVRQMGFKFLIQADFVTQANRQDIVTTSSRNEGLATGIAEAFIKAVLQFCQHGKLQYQWMRYLPQKDGYPWDTFWKSLIKRIGDKLMDTPVLRPAKPGLLRRISESAWLPPDQLDKYGKPLFADITPERYLSLEYRRQDLLLLEAHGLLPLNFNQVIARAAHDLASPESRMKSTTDEDWQSRAAQLLDQPFAKKWPFFQDHVKELNLLPLRGGSKWITNKMVNVYYPRVGDTNLEIPHDAGLIVVDPKAVSNASRKQLFDSLGVQTVSVSQARERIMERVSQRNMKSFWWSPISPKVAASHVRFLYLTEHLSNRPYGYEGHPLMSEGGEMHDPAKADVYLRDDDPWGASKLLGPVFDDSNSSATALECKMFILHGAYLKQTPSPPAPQSLSWKDWLYESFHVRRHLRLVQKDGLKLSGVCHYVAKNEPEKFLGYLQATWGKEEPWVVTDHVVKELSQVEVLCEGGIMRRFASTYLPHTELKQLSSRFLLAGEFFPWLQLETAPSRDVCSPEWEALGRVFGLGWKGPDINFILDILTGINEAAGTEVLSKPERLYELYIYLQAEVRNSSESKVVEKAIRDRFISEKLIFVFEDDPCNGGLWASAEECVWESPIEMTTKYSLVKLYQSGFERFSADRSILTSFFSVTLGVRNCGWEDLVNEIRDFKLCGLTDFDRVSKLYKCLADKRLIAISATQLRDTFETEALICVFSNQIASWHRPSQCLWTGATQIRGMSILQGLYPDLKRFFVGDLGVPTLTAKMVYDKLTGPELSVDEAKQTIETLNSLLPVSKQGKLDPNAILAKAVFPVRCPNGDVKLLKGTDNFALVDRKSLHEDFAREAKFLDFGMDETRKLQPFIAWAGLEKRYLSKLVKEISSANPASTQTISLPSRGIRRKSRALLSIAVAYNSPRTRDGYEDFYMLLRNSETLETDSITSELHLHQDGKLLRVEKETAELHIREDLTTLTVFVPEDESNQDFCFNSKLPQLFSEWIMTDPTSQIAAEVPQKIVNAVQSVLNLNQPKAMAKVLDHHGIQLVEMEGEAELEPEEEQLGSVEGAVDEEEDHGVAGAPRPRTPSRPSDELLQPRIPNNRRGESSDTDDLGTYTPPSSAPSRNASRRSGYGETSDITAARSSHASSQAALQPISSPVLRLPRYTTLLSQVVNAARQTSFPSQGAFDMSALQNALRNPTFDEEVNTNQSSYLDYSMTKLERDKHIGAAGELFVFELLSRLDQPLPGFSRANWQSTIRSYVTSHPDYSDMRPWNGRETADITYADENCALTSFLIDKGYLDSDTWAGVRLQYYIEVKTTMGPCETPFYMSKSQYKRMQDMSEHNDDDRDQDSLYVIFRVFDLCSDSVGLKVLVDPESMRERGELAFTAETWSVVTST